MVFTSQKITCPLASISSFLDCLLFFLYNFFFPFYHNKIYPATNYNAIKNKINKTR